MIRAGSPVAPAPDPAPAQPEQGSEDGPATGTTSDRFHAMNHELRTIELERIPKGARRVLSVGAQGRWYFEWFERSVGPVDLHIGIEAFEPKPDDLPPYVQWIVNTADRMEDVADASVDLVFAGQTSEHLWAHELAGFLREARRVLANGGLLVLDSPNRIVTEHLHWSHGGHTIELSAGEMRELLLLAGFDVVSTRGVWRCEIDGRVLQLEESIDDPAMATRRAATGGDDPDGSFVWWIVASATGTAAAAAALDERVAALFEQHWDTRVCRGLPHQALAERFDIQPGATGKLGETLPFPLHQGHWTVSVGLESGELSAIDDLELRIVSPGDYLVQSLKLADAQVDGRTLSWSFDLPWLIFALSAQLWVSGVTQPASLRLPFSVRSNG